MSDDIVNNFSIPKVANTSSIEPTTYPTIDTIWSQKCATTQDYDYMFKQEFQQF